MPHIAVPEGAPGIRGLLQLRPDLAAPLAEFTQRLMQGPNTLSAGERELIAAYVSALNDCTFCTLSHTALASCHLDESVVGAVLSDPEIAPIGEKLKALLSIAGAVQRSGRAVHTAHIDRARAAGATDLEIHDTVLIAAAFCLFNRYVDGLDASTPPDPESYRQRARLVAAHGYTAPDGAASD